MKELEKKLIEAGGRLWEKNGYRRIYINGAKTLEAVFGLSIERYKSGNVLSAKLCGERISNTQAKAILRHKPYFDCIAESWVDTGCEPLSEFQA